MTNADIIAGLNGVMSIVADRHSDPADRLRWAYMAADALKATLIREEVASAFAALQAVHNWPEVPACDPPEAGSWRDRPPLL